MPCLLLTSCLISCGRSTTRNEKIKPSNNVSTEINSIDEEESEVEYGNCNYDDGRYSANVDYHNDDTGFSNSYSLEIEVENCEVVQINFPKGGWLDSDHISPAELDEDGRCTVYGENGKVYEVEIVE